MPPLPPRLRASVLALAMAVLSGAAAAQPSAWPSSLDPLQMTSCPVSVQPLAAVPPGTWRVDFAVGYFNLWSGTWHTGTIHRVLGRLGEPMQPDELRTIEQDFPADAVHRLDLEGWSAEVVLARGLGAGYVLAFRAPWLQIGAPNWDGVTASFHAVTGISEARRPWFPRGESVVYIHDGGGTLERLDGLDGAGFGDASVSLSGPAGGWAGAEHRWAVVVEGPTGSRGTLRGSGGWDGGVRWRSVWVREAWSSTVDVGYNWLDGAGSFLGIRRADTWHAGADLGLRLGARSWVRLGAGVDSSPLARFTSGLPGRPALTFALGLARRAGQDSWLFLQLGENVASVGAAPDFTLTLGWSTAVRR